MTVKEHKELRAKMAAMSFLLEDYADTETFQSTCHELDNYIEWLGSEIAKEKAARHTDES